MRVKLDWVDSLASFGKFFRPSSFNLPSTCVKALVEIPSSSRGWHRRESSRMCDSEEVGPVLTWYASAGHRLPLYQTSHRQETFHDELLRSRSRARKPGGNLVCLAARLLPVPFSPSSQWSRK